MGIRLHGIEDGMGWRRIIWCMWGVVKAGWNGVGYVKLCYVIECL